jgi:hypothetical protein
MHIITLRVYLRDHLNRRLFTSRITASMSVSLANTSIGVLSISHTFPGAFVKFLNVSLAALATYYFITSLGTALTLPAI